jgi:hypothetical protein
MAIRFVTGGNAAFFNTLLICLRSFAERLPGHRLQVCDFGFTGAQAKFLDSIGLLLPQPPELAGSGVFLCKACLTHYLRHTGLAQNDTVIWLDADITLMDVGAGDFQTVAVNMTSTGAQIAACGEPTGRNIGQTIALFADRARMAPFARIAAEAGIDLGLPYVSTGLFFCRSAVFLERWAELAWRTTDHPLFDQNVFNVVMHRDAVPFLTLDCEEWQAYGCSLDKVSLVPLGRGRPAARIGDKNIKSLHASSPAQGHLLIANCRMTVRNLDLVGPFKLFLAEPLRLHQLQLLASFMVAHGEALWRLGICTPASPPVAGFQFATL